MLKNYLMDEEGMGTVELVLIIAALVSIAVIFRKAIIDFVKGNLSSIFEGASENTKLETE